MATTDEHGLRGNGRGGERDREEMMREPEGSNWRRELDRRTNREEIDRRHGWRRGFGTEGYGAGERAGPPRGPVEAAPWQPGPSYGGSSPTGAGTGGYGSEYHGSSAGYERSGIGYGRGPEAWGGPGGYAGYGGPDYAPRGDFSGSWAERGFGGYGGGEYGGSYGGMGPGPAGTGPSVASWGGPSGAGSLAGTFGETSGWEPERQGMRPGPTPLHARMVEGREAGERAGRRLWEREGPLVRDVMTRNPRTVAPDATVREAARTMREEDAGIMPVVQDGRVIGVVTDRDLAMRVLAEGRNPDQTRVSEVMSSDVHVCTPDDRLVEAVRIMGEENVRRLPVVDRDDHLKGILSMTDVAREAEMDYALQEALEQIARRRSFWSRW